jgi:hypothetical protein
LDIQDVATVWKNTPVFDYSPFVRGILSTFGVPRKTVDRMFQDIHQFLQQGIQPSRLHTDNPHKKCLNDAQLEWFKLQVKPGQKLDATQASFTAFIDKALQLAAFKSDYVLQSAPNVKTVSLYKWCGVVLVEAVTRSFFGEALFKISPVLMEDFFSFEQSSWKILYEYPWFLARDMHTARKRLSKTFVAYFSLPADQKSDASWYIKTQGVEMKHLGFSVEDTAAIAQLYFWV